MNNKAIQIEVRISESQTCKLVLTAQNYKQQFKLFIHQHNIDSSHAFYLKNIVQSRIITLYKGFQEANNQQQLRQQRQINEIVQYKIPKASPRFGNSQQKQTQTLDIEINQDKQNVKTIKKPSQSQSLSSTNIPFLSIPFNCHQSGKKQLPQQYRQEEQSQYSQICFNNIFHQQSSPTIPTIEKVNKINNNDFTTKRKKHSRHSPSQQFDRLHETSTESFRNKHNNDINHKEHADYLQVQKYLMNQRLKRTTPIFFHQLHHKSTASFSAKNSQQKQSIQQKQPIKQSPSKQKRKTPSKIFKGSQWQSGCRCELKIIEAEQLKKKSKSKEKEMLIRQRMMMQKSEKKSIQDNVYKSRSCEKCNPKQKKQKIKQKKKMPEPKKHIPRPYISNILAQSYNQYKKQFSLF